MKLSNILNLFNLRPIEIRIFETIFYDGMMGATEIANKAGISRPAVYDLVKKLIKLGLVIETQQGGKKLFEVSPPEKIKLLINEKKDRLDIANNTFEQLHDDFHANRGSKKPRIQIFEGQEELQQMMKDMLLYRDITVYVFWPIKKIIKLLSPEFYKKFHSDRIKRNIKIKVIWPENSLPTKKQYQFLKDNTELKRTLRIAPENIDFSLGYAIYGNTVRFISSKRESYGFIIESTEMADMMKKQFKLIWGISKEIK